MVLEILTVLLNIAPWHNFAYGADLCGIKTNTAKEIHDCIYMMITAKTGVIMLKTMSYENKYVDDNCVKVDQYRIKSF